MKKYYSQARMLHLYAGLFISPFILIFSLSVLVFNHLDFFSKLWPKKELEPIEKYLMNFQIQNSDSLTAKSIMRQLAIDGEIDWISKNDSVFSFPVNKPGSSKWISYNSKTSIATIVQKDEGLFMGMAYLHSMPGQHNARMRGNSFFMKSWRIVTDVFVYLLLFVSSTGVFLWYFLKPERKFGIYSFVFGIIFFLILLILLF